MFCIAALSPTPKITYNVTGHFPLTFPPTLTRLIWRGKKKCASLINNNLRTSNKNHASVPKYWVSLTPAFYTGLSQNTDWSREDTCTCVVQSVNNMIHFVGLVAQADEIIQPAPTAAALLRRWCAVLKAKAKYSLFENVLGKKLRKTQCDEKLKDSLENVEKSEGSVEEYQRGSTKKTNKLWKRRLSGFSVLWTTFSTLALP